MAVFVFFFFFFAGFGSRFSSRPLRFSQAAGVSPSRVADCEGREGGYRGEPRHRQAAVRGEMRDTLWRNEG